MAAAAAPMLPQQANSHYQLQDDSRQDLPRPYKCPLCDKAFHRLEHQTRHIRTHTGEKPHACQFPGCTKRFSRSDELTRHSRIHNNPNSRRGNKNQNAAAAAAANALVSGSFQDGHLSQMMQSPPQGYNRSAPNSNLGSPNVSPPNSYAPTSSRMAAAYHTGGYESASTLPPPPPPPQHQHLDINLLANAASQVQREDEQQMYANARSRPAHHHHQPHHYSHHHHPYAYHGSSGTRLPSLSAYAMSRSHSQESEDHMSRPLKRSCPGSPRSTAPSSPTFSGNDSHSPTPGHTPSATPAHSPRIRPHHPHSDIHLPGLRHLSLQYSSNQAPSHLEPLEPSDVHPSTHVPHPHVPFHRNSSTNGMSINDIISAPEHSFRKLPLPDLLNGSSNGSASY